MQAQQERSAREAAEAAAQQATRALDEQRATALDGQSQAAQQAEAVRELKVQLRAFCSDSDRDSYSERI